MGGQTRRIRSGSRFWKTRFAATVRGTKSCATSSSRGPNAPEDRGAVWYLYERQNNAQAMAEALAPVVFGVQVKCAQCHDHMVAREIKQAHYWGMVAAFNRSKNVDTPERPGRGGVGHRRLRQLRQSQEGIAARAAHVFQWPQRWTKPGPRKARRKPIRPSFIWCRRRRQNGTLRQQAAGAGGRRQPKRTRPPCRSFRAARRSPMRSRRTIRCWPARW